MANSNRLQQRRTTITWFLIICLELLIIVYLLSFPKEHHIATKQSDQQLALSPVASHGENDNKETTSYPTVKDVVLNYPPLTSPVLLTTVNHGFLELLFNLFYSIQRLKIQPNILVICEDKLSFDELSKNRQNLSLRYNLALTHLEESTTNSTKYRSDPYIQLVQKRVSYIELLLRNNIDILYVDSDIVLLDDPFKYMKGKEDLFIQSETRSTTVVCTGFLFMRANNITKRLVSAWKQALPRDTIGNQRIFNEVLKRFGKRIKVRVLPLDRFLSGKLFALSDVPWQRRVPKPVEIHANFMVGTEQKCTMLKKYGLWFVAS